MLLALGIIGWVLICCNAAVNLNPSEGAMYTRELPSGTQKALQAVVVNSAGEVFECSIAKHQLAMDLKLPLRDLRLLDPPFPGQIQAAFAARPNAVLFTIENIKVIVKNDEAIVFGPNQSEVTEFIPALQGQLQSVCSSERMLRFEHVVIETALNVVCNNLFRKVRALSPAIGSALQELQAESRGLDTIQTQADGLLPLKNQLDELRKRVKEVDRAIKEVLDNDEDMAMMHLGAATGEVCQVEDGEGGAHASESSEGEVKCKEPVECSAREGIVSDKSGAEGTQGTDEPPADSHRVSAQAPSGLRTVRRHRSWHSAPGRSTPSRHHLAHRSSHSTSAYTHHDAHTSIALQDATMSLEILFENYLNEVGWVSSEIDEHLDKIINTEENVALQIDLLRNRILRFELALSMSGFIVACAALVTGLFGMNLLSHVEHHPMMFWAIAGTLVVGMSATWLQLHRYGKRERLF